MPIAYDPENNRTAFIEKNKHTNVKVRALTDMVA